ncbi:MAG: TonB family protein [Thiobacillus sp.]|nr:TonB family protein [Thiobacillus sp.]
MNRVLERLDWNRAAGLLVVLVLHGAVLYGLWYVRVIPHPAETVTLFVSLINPPPPESRPKAIPPPKPPTKPIKQEAHRPVEPPHYHLAAEAPVMSPTEAVEPLPPPDPVVASPQSEPSVLVPSSQPKPDEPVTLASELAMVCPKRTPPTYPPLARRLGETGKVVLRVEIDIAGRVSAAQVVSSSGFDRLDTAALAAVRTWRCHPAQRDGQVVRSVALQPFNFTLEDR